ncbi:caldesmon-like isoform X2 [Dreissena polymorpha]|uniref:caldesmon-like isoform X2 n=1 Tax=Dreissena polymorpha TaxID=45954 RepID=UPI002264014F|nr:caldesmon-like isoform X2 [Dreissena polymorpha]
MWVARRPSQLTRCMLRSRSGWHGDGESGNCSWLPWVPVLVTQIYLQATTTVLVEIATRGDDNDTQDTSSSYSSSRTRRHRNWEEDTPVVNDISSATVDTSAEDKVADRRRRQQEEEEEEARRQAEREAEEERQRQVALERQAAQERQREEAARRRAEQEERDRREEEERRRKPIQDDSFESGSLKSFDDGDDNPQDENKLFIDEDDQDEEDSVGNEKGTRIVFSNISVDKNEDASCFNDDSHEIKVDRSVSVLSEKFLSDRVKVEEKLTTELSVSVREVNNNKIKDKLELFEHLKEEGDTVGRRTEGDTVGRRTEGDTVGRRTVLLPLTDGEGLKGKLAKFEQEIRDQEKGAKEVPAVAARAKKEFATPKPRKLSQKVWQFESARKSLSGIKSQDVKFELEKLGGSQGRRKAMLGRWSASETHINVNNKPDTREANAKKNVLERWKSVEKGTQEKEPVKSPLERKESLQKRLSGNTEFIASRYVEKASKSIDESANLPCSPEPVMQSPLSPGASFKSELVRQEVLYGSDESVPKERKFSVEITIVPSKSNLASQWPTTPNSNATKGPDFEKPTPDSKVAKGPNFEKSTSDSKVAKGPNFKKSTFDSKVAKGPNFEKSTSESKVAKGPNFEKSTSDSKVAMVPNFEKPGQEDTAEESLVCLPQKKKVTDRWPHGDELTEARGLGALNGRGGHSRESSMDKATSQHSRESSMDKSVHSTDSSVDTNSEYPQSRWSQEPHEEEETEVERKQKEEEEARQAKMAEDDSKKKRGKRKGLGGLTPEKKKKLKDFIGEITYTAEELEEKFQELSYRVLPLPDEIDLLTPEELRKFIKKLHEKLAQIHSEAYDIEFKLNKQDKEVADLNMKISDNKGKFAKPVLRKVNKTEQKFAAISKEQKKEHSDFRETLKSVHDDDEN